jgi:hypothetical protein
MLPDPLQTTWRTPFNWTPRSTRQSRDRLLEVINNPDAASNEAWAKVQIVCHDSKQHQ